MYEETLYHRIKNKEKSVEDIVFRKILYDNLYTSINYLSVVQRKRLIIYYFYDMKLKEIAELDTVDITLFEGTNYIYTNYTNAEITLIYPKDNDLKRQEIICYTILEMILMIW